MFKGKLTYSIFFSVVIFAAFIVAGAVAVIQNPVAAEAFINALKDSLFEYITEQDAPAMAVTLFVNNFEVSLILFLGGATFGIATIFILITNGALIGAVVEYAAAKQGIMAVAAGIIPHGIFEIPAFIISAGLGFLLAESMWMEFGGKGDAAESALKAGKIFAAVVVPLLAVAAIIEAFITPQVIDLVLQGVY